MDLQRRLSDKIIAAHKLACEGKHHHIASLLLEALEVDLSAIGGDKEENRQRTEAIEDAFDLHEMAFGSLALDDA